MRVEQEVRDNRQTGLRTASTAETDEGTATGTSSVEGEVQVHLLFEARPAPQSVRIQLWLEQTTRTRYASCLSRRRITSRERSRTLTPDVTLKASVQYPQYHDASDTTLKIYKRYENQLSHLEKAPSTRSELSKVTNTNKTAPRPDMSVQITTENSPSTISAQLFRMSRIVRRH